MPGQSPEISVHVPQGKAADGAHPSRSATAPTALAGQWIGGGGLGGDAQVLAELRDDIAEELPSRARATAAARSQLQAARRMDSARASASAALQPLVARAASSDPRTASADGARAGSGTRPGRYPWAPLEPRLPERRGSTRGRAQNPRRRACDGDPGAHGLRARGRRRASGAASEIPQWH